MYRSAAASVSSSTWTLVSWDAENEDVVQGGDSPSHDLVTNPERVYIRTAGRYAISGQVTFADDSSSTRRLRLRLNSAGSSSGGTSLLESFEDPLSGVPTPIQIPTIEYDLAAGDYLEVFVYQASGSSLALTVGYPSTFLNVRFVAA